MLGLHDNHAGLNRSYLCKDKAAHATAIDKGLIWWKGRLGVTPIACHADNAPDLIAGAAGEVLRSHQVYQSSCAPYDPKGTVCANVAGRRRLTTRLLPYTPRVSPTAFGGMLGAMLNANRTAYRAGTLMARGLCRGSRPPDVDPMRSSKFPSDV